jgi:hypothetical protein
MVRGYLSRRLDGISYVTDIAAPARRIGVINAFSPDGAVARISPASQLSNQLTSFFLLYRAERGMPQ